VEVGVIPTEEARVVDTFADISRLHDRISCLVDGDREGLRYATGLIGQQPHPFAIIRWNDGETIEDAIGWILRADENVSVPALASLSDPSPGNVGDIVVYLRAHKMDIVAYELVAEVVASSQPCRTRASELLGMLGAICMGRDVTTHFAQDANGIWIFRP
jgi:hypothetical protein